MSPSRLFNETENLEVGNQNLSPIEENARLRATIEILLRGKKGEHNEVNQDELS
jgi:hypothetical protein